MQWSIRDIRSRMWSLAICPPPQRKLLSGTTTFETNVKTLLKIHLANDNVIKSLRDWDCWMHYENFPSSSSYFQSTTTNNFPFNKRSCTMRLTTTKTRTLIGHMGGALSFLISWPTWSSVLITEVTHPLPPLSLGCSVERSLGDIGGSTCPPTHGQLSVGLFFFGSPSFQ